MRFSGLRATPDHQGAATPPKARLVGAPIEAGLFLAPELAPDQLGCAVMAWYGARADLPGNPIKIGIPGITWYGVG
jgi:hypothetical protein